MAALSGFLKRVSEKAGDVYRDLQNLRIGDSLRFPGKDGDILFSKNNVCLHPAANEEIEHVPGYLTLHCQRDDVLGVTLIMQWMPNATLEKNPRSIRTMSPQCSPRGPILIPTMSKSANASPNVSVRPFDDQVKRPTPPVCLNDCMDNADPHYSVEMQGDQLRVVADGGTENVRPDSLCTDSLALGVPSINVIPNTPITGYVGEPGEIHPASFMYNNGVTSSNGSEYLENAEESPATSDAEDDLSDAGDHIERRGSSPYSDPGDAGATTPSTEAVISSLLNSFRNVDLLGTSPENFAERHNLMLPDAYRDDVAVPTSQAASTSGASLFSVDLGKMRTLRLFYSNPECTCGQLVIASTESRYKILHFHYGGLDKLAQIFEQWSVLRAKSFRRAGSVDSPAEHKAVQFAIGRPEVSRGELHPEEGLYDIVNWDFWRSCTNKDGAIEDALTVRKTIFFAGVEPSLRREAWPFLLHVYPWNSVREQRDTIRNDLFLEYQNTWKKRLKLSTKNAEYWRAVEQSVEKDVVRTDRRNPFYQGDNNPNVDTMKNILVNYAAFCPQIGYIQGMSDLLAAILAEVRNEADAFWCFAGLMQRTIFVSVPRLNDIDRNLELLRELLKLFSSDFYAHLRQLGGDALQLLFTHRWILLCFKREFPEADALRMWEACWTGYLTDYFHLFLCLAIIVTYGQDVLQQSLSHDEILLYFSSLAMHMSGALVLKKARGLLYQFTRSERIPCTLAALCDLASPDTWEGGHQPLIECVQAHAANESCPQQGT